MSNKSLTEEEKDVDLLKDIFLRPTPPSETDPDTKKIIEISKKYPGPKWLKILWKAFWAFRKASKEKAVKEKAK